MSTMFRTHDVFELNNEEMKWFKVCVKQAKKCGLNYEIYKTNKHLKLYMTGTKKQFVKYYLKTLLQNKYVSDGILRLVSFIKEKS